MKTGNLLKEHHLYTESLPFISVVIPVYNSPEGINKTLQSICDQTYPNSKMETIVVDNGSTDDTLAVIKSYRQVKLMQENDIQGSYAARNKGVKAAKGEVIAFTDADCGPNPDWLLHGISMMLDKQTDLVAGNIIITLSKSPTIWEYYDSIKHLDQEKYVTAFSFGATANLFVRRKVFDQIGLFRDDLQSGGDLEFCRRSANAGNTIFFAREAVVYHPARSTFREIKNKTVRVVAGQKYLATLGLIEKKKFDWQDLKPVLKTPSNEYKITLWQKLQMIIIMSAFKYYILYLRLK